jgi:hypothetical protein
LVCTLSRSPMLVMTRVFIELMPVMFQPSGTSVSQGLWLRGKVGFPNLGGSRLYR